LSRLSAFGGRAMNNGRTKVQAPHRILKSTVEGAGFASMGSGTEFTVIQNRGL